MRSFLQDVRYACRMFAQSPGATGVAVLSLALGIAVNSTIFTLVNAAVFGMLDYLESERLVTIRETVPDGGGGQRLQAPAIANVVDWKTGSSVFEDIAVGETFIDNSTIIADGPAESVPSQAVSNNLLRLLGVQPVVGRGFLPGEGSGGSRALLISHAFWQRRFAGRPEVVGTTVLQGGSTATIVGVMPAGFHFLRSAKVDVWSAINLHDPSWQDRKDHWFSAVGRLKPGMTLERAQAELDAVSARLAREYPDTNKEMGAKAGMLREETLDGFGSFFLPLMGAVGFVLLMACGNVANLLLARLGTRGRELTVRAALGATRARLARQMFTESLLLAAFAGCLGLLLTAWGAHALGLLLPDLSTSIDVTGPDRRVLLFTLFVTAAAAVLFGMAPAWRASRMDPDVTLKQAGRTGAAAATGKLRGALVVAEVALVLVLLTGAGLMVRTLVRIWSVSPGFDPGRILTMHLHVTGPTYQKASAGMNHLTPAVDLFYDRLLERAAALPGVESAAYTSDLPDTGSQGRTFTFAGRPDPPESERPRVAYYEVSPGFFQTMRIPLRSGRVFDANDRKGSQWTVVIDEEFARRYFPGEDPVGKVIRMRYEPYKVQEEHPRVIIGVVGSVKFYRQSQNQFPVAYASTLQQPDQFPGGRASAHLRRRLLIRTTADMQASTGNLTRAVEAMVAETDKEIPVTKVLPMNSILAQTELLLRSFVKLLGLFGLLAAVLAAIGIYGVMSYTVTDRTPELGIRMALGASRRVVLRMVLNKALSLTALGIAIGSVLGFALARVLQHLLSGTSLSDPIVYGAAILIVALVAFVAAYIPARRAANLDPMAALRME